MADYHTTDAPMPATTDTSTGTVSTRTGSTTHCRYLDLPNTPALVAYLHAVAGYPVKTMWLAAIKRGAYATWLGLTYELAAKYCPDLDEMLLGHMAQPRQHI